MTQPARRAYEFGEFCLDSTERILLRHGEPVPLTPKVFDTLLKLVEEHGRLIEKDEFMARLWPGTYVGEDTLAHNISVIRKVLGDAANGQKYIATVPKRGYRFVATVRETTGVGQKAGESGPAAIDDVTTPGREEKLNEASEATLTVHAGSEPARELPLLHRLKASGFPLGMVGLIAPAVLVGLVAGYVTFALLSPARVPRVVGVTQITRSGRVDPWRRMVSDGSRVYFLERAGDHWNVMQTSIEGGESQIVAAPFRNTLPLDISPDRTEFLIASFTIRDGLMPLWIWPVQGGAPRRVGEVMAYDARWFGQQQIIYAKNDGIYVVQRDGAGSRLIASTEGRPSTFSWSPDGRRLRVTVDEDDFRTAAIWEMDADGKHLHRLFPGRGDPPHEENGVWVPDGSYYIFGEFQGGSFDLWATQEKASSLHRRQTVPVRLTTGPEQFNDPLVAGGRVFVVGTMGKAELVHFDPKSNQSATLFASLQPWGATYSRDGRWAVVSPPNGSLRKIKADGTEVLSLTVPPLRADSPAWSPDGKQVAFGGRTRVDQFWKLYVTSADGGTPREIVPNKGEQEHPTWSPDGKLLAFDQQEKITPGTSVLISIQVLNLTTNQLSLLKDSQGTFNPSWSPDGRSLAALGDDGHKLMLFDWRTQSWAQVAEGNFIGGALFWSGDSKFLYFQDLLAPNEPVYRLHTNDRRIERVASFEGFLEGGVPRCGFQGLTPDGALLVVLLRNHADIYALDLSVP